MSSGTSTLRLNTSSVKKKTVNSNVLSLNLKLLRTEVDIQSVIRDYSLRNYVVMSNHLIHENYLNTVSKAPKTLCC